MTTELIDVQGRALTRQPKSREELGATGTTFFGGRISEMEYNADLRGEQAIKTYDKMRRSDGQVKAGLLVCELPIRSATWSIERASDTPQDREVAEYVEDNLFRGLSHTFDSLLRHALLMHVFGFYVMEKVFEIKDGRVYWRKFAPRLPKTIHKWVVDESGGLAGVQQLVWKNGQYNFIDIPVEKLLVFTHEQEGSNFEGVSLLRAAYKHWYYADNLYRIDGIAAERHSVGVMVFTHPANASDAQISNLDTMGEQLYAHERAYLRLPDGVKLDILGAGGRLRPIIPSIQHHNGMIVRSILAQFLNLGQSEVGSYALSQDQSGFFLMALRATAKNIAETFNRYAIKQLVDYNFVVDDYPRLTFTGIEPRQIEKYAKAVADLVNAGAIQPDVEIEKVLRDGLHLPPPPSKSPQATEPRRFKEATSHSSRNKTQAEEGVNFAEIEKRLDGAVRQVLEAARDIQKRQIDKLVILASKAVEKKDLTRAEMIDVPYKAEMAKAIAGVLNGLFDYGQGQVIQELKVASGNKKQSHTQMALTESKQPESLGAEDEALSREFLEGMAKAGVVILAAKLKGALMWEVLRQVKDGIISESAMGKVMEELSDRELRVAAQSSVNEAFNLGRNAGARKHRDEIGRVQYSAIIDGRTCPSCARLDGNEWDYDDERTATCAAGNPDCEGQGRCRCVLVYIAKSEARGVK